MQILDTDSLQHQPQATNIEHEIVCSINPKQQTLIMRQSAISTPSYKHVYIKKSAVSTTRYNYLDKRQSAASTPINIHLNKSYSAASTQSNKHLSIRYPAGSTPSYKDLDISQCAASTCSQEIFQYMTYQEMDYQKDQILAENKIHPLGGKNTFIYNRMEEMQVR